MAVNCARQAGQDKVKRFVHFSTAQVYDCNKVRFLQLLFCSCYFCLGDMGIVCVNV